MRYNLFEHRHRFATWAAARAAQRGFTNTKNLCDALEKCGVKAFVENKAKQPINAKSFEEYHQEWCRAIIAFLKKKRISNVTYGRAAKLVAVYLKSMIVIGPYSDSDLAWIAHPPIDRILLQNISKSPNITSGHKSKWKSVTWTKLDEDAYYELVSELRETVPDAEPFWALEKYWTITSD